MIPRRFARIRAVLDRRQPDLTVLMEQVNKSHNFSAILRNCDAAGVLEAHVVPPEEGLDVHKTSSAGTDKWVAVRRHGSVGDAFAHLKAQGFRMLAAHPGHNATDYREVDFTQPTCIVVGAELYGLSKETLQRADGTVAVPMMGMVRSLNVSVATALLLFEAARQRTKAGMYDEPKLDRELYDSLAFEWAYPRIAQQCRERGDPYPDLDEDGQLLPS